MMEIFWIVQFKQHYYSSKIQCIINKITLANSQKQVVFINSLKVNIKNHINSPYPNFIYYIY